jgi:hypothetical protein
MAHRRGERRCLAREHTGAFIGTAFAWVVLAALGNYEKRHVTKGSPSESPDKRSP